MSLPFIGLVQGKTLPDFIRKNSPNPNEFAKFAFNLLMRPDDHATKSRSSPSCEFSPSLAKQGIWCISVSELPRQGCSLSQQA